MNQWKIEISELMEQYTDTEFIPEEEHELDVDLIKKRVITAVQGKRHTARRTGLVAAALAACLALVGWAYGEQIYTLMSGDQLSIGENHISISLSTGYDEAGTPLVVSWEAGRLWFVADGQHIDITDRINESTPYIYSSEDDEGNRTVVVVGGEPERCGWMERWEAADGMSAAEVYDSMTGSGEKEPAWLVNARAQLGITE